MLAAVNTTSLGAFGVVIAITVGITVWAARRSRSTSGFLTASHSISGPQNGLAIAGDFVSAATFLGITGLIFLVGIEGWTQLGGAIVALLLMLLLFAERMRNAGEYTVADVLSFRLSERPARVAAASAVLSVGFVFLIAQLVGAGVLLNALTGIGFAPSVLLTGGSMLLYVVFGGMLATTWVQIVKALILGATTLALTIWVCGRVGFNPLDVITGAADRHPAGEATFGPGVAGASPINVISGTLAFALGSAALPHILVRFFTVPDGDQARKSMGWTLGFVGIICIVTSVLGFGTRLVLGDGPAAAEATASGGTLAVPLMAQELGGGAGTAGGDLMLALVTAVAFATILAVVAGLVISGSGAAAHDIWTMVVRRGQGSDREQALVARVAAAGLGMIGIILAILAGPSLNTAFLVGLALSVSAAGVFPALLLALSWRRFNTVGAVAGIATGLIASLIMIVLSPSVWPGPEADAPVQLSNPALVTVPLSFLACWIGTLAGGHRVERRSFAELLFRSETGWTPETAVDARTR